MASLLPLIQDILPMILPASVTVTKAAEILPSESEKARAAEIGTSGVRVISRNAVVDKTDKMCTSILIVKPNSCSSVRHHGEQEAIIYAVSGKGSILSQPKGDDDDEPERHELEPGDFAFIPAWTEHQAVNNSEVDWHLVIIRSGGRPIEVNLTGWGGAESKEAAKQ